MQAAATTQTTRTWTLDRIAGLSHQDISEMTDQALIDVIQVSGLDHLQARRPRHLEYLSRCDLERMAHLACRCCRHTWGRQPR
jgi:hypothetical protein